MTVAREVTELTPEAGEIRAENLIVETDKVRASLGVSEVMTVQELAPVGVAEFVNAVVVAVVAATHTAVEEDADKSGTN